MFVDSFSGICRGRKLYLMTACYDDATRKIVREDTTIDERKEENRI